MPLAWPFYLLGVLLALAGFVALRRVVDEAQDHRRSTGPLALLACVLAFALGGSVIVVAMGFDSEQTRVETSRTFSLHISVAPASPGPFSVSLPAPTDPRVQLPLNRTNGSATLRLVGNASAPSLRVDASGNTSFDITMTVVGGPFNRTLTRLSVGPPSNGTAPVSAFIGLQATTNVRVTFAVRYSEFCSLTTYALEAVVANGVGVYPGQWTVQLLGCPAGS